jgi:hypothetical protein
MDSRNLPQETVEGFSRDLIRAFVFLYVPPAIDPDALEEWIIIHNPEVSRSLLDTISYLHVHDKIVAEWRRDGVELKTFCFSSN